MTSKELVKIGEKIEEYEYINQYDFDNQYYGRIYLYDNKLYELVFDSNFKLIDEEEEPRIVCEDVNDAMNTPYDYDTPIPIDIKMEKPEKINNNNNNNTQDFSSYFNSMF
jgi:hypothetical protein